MEKRNIPRKNYLLFTCISIGTIALVIYLSLWYKTISEYNNKNSIMIEVLSEVEKESLSSFLIDNSDIVVYLSSSTDTNVKSFEKQFKKLITDEGIKSDIVYLDLSKESNSDILKLFKDNYLNSDLRNIKKIVEPNLLVFYDGEITSILYTKKTKINIKDVKGFLSENEIIIND